MQLSVKESNDTGQIKIIPVKHTLLINQQP